MIWTLQRFIARIRAMSDEELIEVAKTDMREECDMIIFALTNELRSRFPDRFPELCAGLKA